MNRLIAGIFPDVSSTWLSDKALITGGRYYFFASLYLSDL